MLKAWLLFIENDVEIGFEVDESIVPLDKCVVASKPRRGLQGGSGGSCSVALNGLLVGDVRVCEEEMSTSSATMFGVMGVARAVLSV